MLKFDLDLFSVLAIAYLVSVLKMKFSMAELSVACFLPFDDRNEKYCTSKKLRMMAYRLDGAYDDVRQRPEDRGSEAEGMLDHTFDKVGQNLGDVKSTFFGR